jgi:peptidoglycan/LPS O-acetylase OafA/YrhL
MRVVNKMKHRLYTLDIFRIFSVLFIFLFHSNLHLGCNYSILTPFISQGAIFMVGFFMISGFALYQNYYDKDLLHFDNLKTFYLKRLIKLYPLYICIYIIFLIFKNTLTFTQNIIIAPIELLLLQSFFDGLFNVLHNSGTWFMSCLFFSYLLFPFLKDMVIKFRTKKELFITLYFLTVLAPIVANIYKTSSIYANPFFRLLEFLIGMIIADFSIKNIHNIKNIQLLV